MPRPLFRCLFLAVLVIALSGINHLAAAQTATPPATPTATTAQNDAACAGYGNALIAEYRANGLTRADLALISNCFVDADGDWFMATGPDDPRIAGGPILTPDEKAVTASIVAGINRLVEEVLGEAGLIPAVTADGSPIAGVPTFRDALDSLYSPIPLPVTGHLKPDYTGVDVQWVQGELKIAQTPLNPLSDYLDFLQTTVKTLQTRVCVNGGVPFNFQPACTAALAGLPLYPAHVLDDLYLAEFSRIVLDHPNTYWYLLVPLVPSPTATPTT